MKDALYPKNLRKIHIGDSAVVIIIKETQNREALNIKKKVLITS
tara:strand:- start:254 stop:385 length:132 start_codon:yes stop_codon:yes gene_type:complete